MLKGTNYLENGTFTESQKSKFGIYEKGVLENVISVKENEYVGTTTTRYYGANGNSVLINWNNESRFVAN